MNINTNTAKDTFFSMLNCAETYLDYKNADEDERDEMSEDDMDKVIAYATYLARLNNLSLKQTGEGL
jgi:hypothetical protein